MGDPFSVIGSAVKKSVETGFAENIAIVNAVNNDNVAPLGLVASTTLAEMSFAEKTTEITAEITDQTRKTQLESGLLKGMLYAETSLMTTGCILSPYPMYDFGMAKVFDILQESGLKEPVQLGLQDSINLYEPLLDPENLELVKICGWPGYEPLIDADPVKLGRDPAAYAGFLNANLNPETIRDSLVGKELPLIEVVLQDLVEFEQSMLRWCDEKGCLLTAKRIDFKNGSQYVGGIATDLPLIGGLSNILCKRQLDVEIVTQDKEQLVKDAINVTLVVTLVAAPYLLPAGAVSAGAAAFVTKTAITGAAIGGIHGAIQNGATAVIRGEATSEILADVGKGMVGGATLGAIGGAAGGAVLYRLAELQKLGLSLAVSVKAGSAAGAATGSMAAGAETWKTSGDISETLAASGEGLLKGGALGGLLGAGGHAVGGLTTKIRPLGDWPEGLEKPSGLLVRTVRDSSWTPKYGGYEIKPGFQRHHIKPLSLGGTDTAANITMVPTAIHKFTKHPPYATLKAPASTWFH